jgi:hypothetical protein
MVVVVIARVKPDSRSADTVGDLGGGLEVEIRHHHSIAIGRQPPRDSRPDPAATAGDKGYSHARIIGTASQPDGSSTKVDP